MKTLRTLITMMLMLFGLSVDAQISSSKSNIQEILGSRVDKLAKSFFEDTLLTSLSIGVHYQGEEFVRHFGELDKGKGNTSTDQTIFDIGSVTKTFVGTLFAMAEAEGKLSLNDDIRKYLTGDFSNLEFESHPIKLRHLITHTSGLPQFLPLRVKEEFENKDPDLTWRIAKILDEYSKEEFLDDLSTLELDTIPGFKYAYSNAGAELTSYILEQVYKKPFEKILEDELLIKADMPSTGITLTQIEKKSYANGYGDAGVQAPGMNTTLWGGSGYGKSTIKDLMSYIEYQINTDDPVILKTRQMLYEDKENRWTPKMGYLWQVKQDVDLGLRIRHHGGSFGMQNWLMIYPEEEFGISVITNQSGRNTGWPLWNVLNGIVEEMAKHKYRTDKTETELITETLTDYIEGSTNGQPERLKNAFHPELNLYYVYDREFSTWSGTDYIADTKEGEPTGEQGKILSIDHENDIATAKIEISEPGVDTPYIDYLMLMKLQGQWTIIHKMFTKRTSE